MATCVECGLQSSLLSRFATHGVCADCFRHLSADDRQKALTGTVEALPEVSKSSPGDQHPLQWVVTLTLVWGIITVALGFIASITMLTAGQAGFALVGIGAAAFNGLLFYGISQVLALVLRIDAQTKRLAQAIEV